MNNLNFFFHPALFACSFFSLSIVGASAPQQVAIKICPYCNTDEKTHDLTQLLCTHKHCNEYLHYRITTLNETNCPACNTSMINSIPAVKLKKKLTDPTFASNAHAIEHAIYELHFPPEVICSSNTADSTSHASCLCLLATCGIVRKVFTTHDQAAPDQQTMNDVTPNSKSALSTISSTHVVKRSTLGKTHDESKKDN